MTSNGTDPYPPEEKALNAALAAAQGEFPPISRERTVEVKTRDGSKYSYSYAPLDVILAGVRPALAKHGLALVQRLENPGGQGPAIRTELRHAEGAVIASSFPLGERPSSPQQLGSLLTYLRRYAIVAMLGIAPEDDDDGQVAAVERRPPSARKTAVKPDPRPEPADVSFTGDPGQMVLTFGKYQGQTIADVAAKDRQYVGMIAHKSSDEKTKAAALAFLHDDDIPF